MTRLPMDIHSHSEYSPDANYPVSMMCDAALLTGVGVFAITDHYDINQSIKDFSRLDARTRGSVKDAIAAKERFQDKMLVLAGIELGQGPENLDKSEEILSSYAFDFVIGSLHNAPGRLDLGFYKPAIHSVNFDEELEYYFPSLIAMIRWGRFDSVGHISYPFRYILSFERDYPVSKWDDHMDAVVRAIVEKGLAMELNTSGTLRSAPPRFMPDARWVTRFRELGGEKLTLGADAHAPAAVAAGISEGSRIAAEAGFTRLCYFENREAKFVDLE